MSKKPTTTKRPELPADFQRIRVFSIWTWRAGLWQKVAIRGTREEAVRYAEGFPFEHWFVTQCAEEIVDSSDQEQSK